MRKFTVEIYDEKESDLDYKIVWLNEQGNYHSPDDDTPATENRNGTKTWFCDGHYHRISGPAIMWANGGESYWLEGINYSKEEHAKKVAELQKEPSRKDMTIAQIEEALGYVINLVAE